MGEPSIGVVVPARDEAAVLPETLPILLAQDYPGELTVWLVDDGSSDGTADLARTLADGPGSLTVLAAPPPPPGWTGKLNAVQRGVAAAGAAGVELLLLTDADISHQPSSVRRLVATALADDRDLVSLMALLRVQTGWERFLVPAFVYFFAQLYPFGRVSRPGGRTAAAAGGCVLVRSTALERAGGLARISGNLIDDVALGRLLKLSGVRTWLGFAGDPPEVRSVRPYSRLADLWHMVTRSAYTQLQPLTGAARRHARRPGTAVRRAAGRRARRAGQALAGARRGRSRRVGRDGRHGGAGAAALRPVAAARARAAGRRW
jgi:hopene-associated glycosyltransferase HpnB